MSCHVLDRQALPNSPSTVMIEEEDDEVDHPTIIFAPDVTEPWARWAQVSTRA
jgi:hypothetical protein